jgi:MoxR-like ATPase
MQKSDDAETFEQLQQARTRIHAELGKAVVGQREVIEQILIALFAGGHCLITGAPGLAKTLLVKSIAQIFHLEFRRVQFTPDLMPTDITGVARHTNPNRNGRHVSTSGGAARPIHVQRRRGLFARG